MSQKLRGDHRQRRPAKAEGAAAQRTARSALPHSPRGLATAPRSHRSRLRALGSHVAAPDKLMPVQATEVRAKGCGPSPGAGEAWDGPPHGALRRCGPAHTCPQPSALITSGVLGCSSHKPSREDAVPCATRPPAARKLLGFREGRHKDLTFGLSPRNPLQLEAPHRQTVFSLPRQSRL